MIHSGAIEGTLSGSHHGIEVLQAAISSRRLHGLSKLHVGVLLLSLALLLQLRVVLDTREVLGVVHVRRVSAFHGSAELRLIN